MNAAFQHRFKDNLLTLSEINMKCSVFDASKSLVGVTFCVRRHNPTGHGTYTERPLDVKNTYRPNLNVD